MMIIMMMITMMMMVIIVILIVMMMITITTTVIMILIVIIVVTPLIKITILMLIRMMVMMMMIMTMMEFLFAGVSALWTPLLLSMVRWSVRSAGGSCFKSWRRHSNHFDKWNCSGCHCCDWVAWYQCTLDEIGKVIFVFYLSVVALGIV